MMTESAGTSGIRTFIWGSCVSRDTFGYLDDHFTLHRYVARQSLISAGNTVQGVAEKLAPIASAFQQRVVSGDLDGDLFASLQAAAGAVDLVLIDLVDERGGVMKFGDSYATRLHEFWGAGGREASRGTTHLRLGSDEHFALWRRGAEQLRDELRHLDLLDRTLVLRAQWASTFEDGSPLDIPEWMMRPDVADTTYGRYFDQLAALGFTIVELPDDLARSSREHQWGASPFHYQDAAYEFFARAIRRAAGVPEAPPEPPALSRRDTSAWGTFTDVRAVEEIEDADLSDGLLTVWQDGLPFDFLIEDNGSDTTLVSFHAALGASGIEPPVFTARAVTAELGMNRIFVSDPGLLMGDSLGVAWYLGTTEVDATAVLTSAIAAIQARMKGKHLVFFGMSGGGFASMNISHEFPGSLAVPVNPQSRILDYAVEHWDELGRRCLGGRTTDESRAALEAHPRADLRKIYAAAFDNTIMYVQNAADPHTTSQLIPWFEAIGWTGNASILFGRWGKGHVPPPGPELRSMLKVLPELHGDWAQLPSLWKAEAHPTREWVRSTTGR